MDCAIKEIIRQINWTTVANKVLLTLWIERENWHTIFQICINERSLILPFNQSIWDQLGNLAGKVSSSKKEIFWRTSVPFYNGFHILWQLKRKQQRDVIYNIILMKIFNKNTLGLSMVKLNKEKFARKIRFEWWKEK